MVLDTSFANMLKYRRYSSVIFLTVRDDEKDIIRGLDMGADDYVVKPFCSQYFNPELMQFLEELIQILTILLHVEI
ncbi:hypothetical protein [Clostridioides difficile]|uniref:hypothetical protein n=1 Tax=Clostridioides difficile TaxID=1496 RepID=UPI001F389CA4|nr:hypothetical protein [Clostridioides difficile]